VALIKSLIYDFVSKYDKKFHPFHMPGHKGNRDFLPSELLNFDITEIPQADNLYNPQGIIANFSDNLAEFYGAAKSFFLVNGSSCGICAAILATCNSKSKILIVRGAHISLYHGLILSGASPVYIAPPIIKGQFAGSVNPDDIEKILIENADISVCFVTSPTYEGIVSDIAKIAVVCHNNGVILILDEAHGAHLAISEYFPVSGLKSGADIVINSLHKTMPIMGQSAVLHINSETKIDTKRLQNCIRLMQTTSPSYILMAQADYVIAKIYNNPSIFGRYIENLEDLRRDLVDFDFFRMIDKDFDNGIYDFDPSKIVLYSDKEGETENLNEYFLSKYGIIFEAVYSNHIIAMTSCADSPKAYKTLQKGLESYIDKGANLKSQYTAKTISFPLPQVCLTPKEAHDSRQMHVPIMESSGKVAAEFVIPYPPGIPIIAPGEIITPDVLSAIETYNKRTFDMENMEISVIV